MDEKGHFGDNHAVCQARDWRGRTEGGSVSSPADVTNNFMRVIFYLSSLHRLFSIHVHVSNIGYFFDHCNILRYLLIKSRRHLLFIISDLAAGKQWWLKLQAKLQQKILQRLIKTWSGCWILVAVDLTQLGCFFYPSTHPSLSDNNFLCT